MRRKELQGRLDESRGTSDALSRRLERAIAALRDSEERLRLMTASGRVLKELLDETDQELRLYKECFQYATKMLAASLGSEVRNLGNNVPSTAEELHQSILTLIRSKQENEADAQAYITSEHAALS